MDSTEPNQDAGELWQAIDACRPGSDDECAPEMAELAAELQRNPRLAQAFASAQRFDMQVAEALDDVPLPEGFEQRLLTALSLNAVHTTQAIKATTNSSPVAEPVATVPFATLSSQRRWIGAAIAVAAAVVIGAWLAWPRTQLTAESLPVAAQQWFLDFDPAMASWQSTVITNGFTFPVNDLGARRPRWTAVRTGDGYYLAAYDLSAPTVRAYLFVLDGGPQGLPTQPPAVPQRSTGQQTVAVWQAGGLTYALVVEGDSSAYQRFLLPPPQTAGNAASYSSRLLAIDI
jgi:hypothetical protein